MFDNMSVVTTAISSFNNAALLGPYFFAMALLSVPLFFMVYVYGRDFVGKIGWTNRNIENQTGFWSVAVLVLWIMIFGGNYAVIRDGVSLLPCAISVVLFFSMVFITQNLIKLNYLSKINSNKFRWFLFLTVFILAAFSAMPTWWGILLQISAVLCGIIVGCRISKPINTMVATTLVFGMMIVLVLMQPEYFRFGQLGNLTLIHLLMVMVGGFFAVMALVTKYVNARSRIYQSAYVKLKWFFRIVSCLAFVLFVSTESVPVFVGLMASLGLSAALTIYHGNALSVNLCKYSWAMMLICVGIMITCPVISALGIIYMVSLPSGAGLKDFTKLL